VADDFDVIVIGSGAGGAPIASELARAGRGWRILILEKGPRLRTQEDDPHTGLSGFKRDEMYNAGPEKWLTLDMPGNPRRPFYSSHVEPDINDEPHVYSPHNEETQKLTVEGYTAQVVGGGTQLYGAVHLRFSEKDFRLASDRTPADLPGAPYGDAEVDIQDWPITYQDLLPYYEKTERLIGINGTVLDVSGNGQAQLKPFRQNDYQTPVEPNPISAYALDGMRAMGAKVYRTPLAVITEAHPPSGRPQPVWVKTGYVNRYGDPLGYKSNTWVALLRPAMRDVPGAIELRCNCTVTHLECQGPRVSRVHYRDASGFAKSATGRFVIVACSAIESVRLLMISAEEDLAGFGARVRYNTADTALGRFFLTHCFGGAEVNLPGDVRFDKSQSLDSDYACDLPSSADFLLEKKLWAGAAVYNNTSDQALPVTLARTDGSNDLDDWWNGFIRDMRKTGEGMRQWIDADFGRRLSVSFMANQIPWRKNYIKLSGVRDKWGRKSAWVVKDWHPHDAYLMGVMAEFCRDVLLRGVPGSFTVNPDGGNPWGRGIVDYGSVRGNGTRIANHILGGARFGNNRQTSVLDRNCRVWDFDNLFVTDGSFMPTSGGANPTHTIEANAFRVADVLKQLL
jgi:choline dehydrogenase-like flavoprotein